MSEDKIRAFMEEHKYEEEIAEKFFVGGKNSDKVFSKETKRLINPTATWLTDEDCINVWPVIKEFLWKIEERNQEQEKYLRITLSQIILFTTLIGMRKRTVKTYMIV